VSPVTPRLNSQGLLAVADDAFLHESIARGRPGAKGRGQPGTKMPVFAEMLADEEIGLIVQHVRRWQTAPRIALADYEADGDVGRGQALYLARCAECHGADGWGESAPRLAGETFQAIASDAFIRHTVLNGRPGTAMAAFPLSDAEVADLVTFIRTLGTPGATPGSG
jgi:mono/diheme cytochrome c family protein